MDKMAGEGSLGGREHYYLDFSAQLDENIDKVSSCAGVSSPSTTFIVHPLVYNIVGRYRECFYLLGKAQRKVKTKSFTFPLNP